LLKLDSVADLALAFAGGEVFLATYFALFEGDFSVEGSRNRSELETWLKQAKKNFIE
jgi:hypothetical protein